MEISKNLAIVHILVFWQCLGTVMVPLAVSFHLLIKDQGLVEGDLSTILVPFDSNQFMLCPLGYVIPSEVVPCPLPSSFTRSKESLAIQTVISFHRKIFLEK